MGGGTLDVFVTDQGNVRTVSIPLTVYLNTNKRILAVAKIFGWQVVPATLDTRGGLSVRFDPLPAGPPFPNVSYALKRITLSFGASRVVQRRVRGHVTKTRLDLLRNPRSCTGSWATSVKLTFRDGSVTPLSAPTPCTPR
jgi:hypothetical protein